MDYKEYLINNLDKETATNLIESIEKTPINCLRINTFKATTDEFEKLFGDLIKHKYVEEAYYFNKEENAFGKNPLHNAGMFYIQDASAMMSAKILDIREDELVFDMCASPGGKSAQIGAYLNNSGILLSNDLSYKRTKTLSKNIERMGLDNVIISNEDANELAKRFLGYFDKVLLDAPCSGLGMFRKNKEVLKDWSYDKVLSLKEIQKELILNAYKSLKYKGKLLYSTCTFTTEENEDVVKYLLNNTNAKIVNIELKKDFSKAIDLEGAIRLYPHKFEGEGHFIALIESNDYYESKISNKNKLAHPNDIKIFKEFEKEYLNKKFDGDFIMMGDNLHILPKNCFSLDRISLLRNGLMLGEIRNKRFIPAHSLAMNLKKNEFKNIINLDYNDIQVNDYLKGMTLPSYGKKGYNLLLVNDISLGFLKDDLSISKNLYPKGLRVNYKEED